MSAKPKNKIFDNSEFRNIINDITEFLNSKMSLFNIEGFTAPIILKKLTTYAELLYLYKSDERPFSIAYSGGKDSTATMDVVFKALLLNKFIYGEMHKITYVMFSDTLLEMDPVIEGILDSIDEIEKFGLKYNLNLEIKRVSPIVKNTFFSLLIGKGYMVPRRDNRWCTDRLKVLPQKKAIVEILNKTKIGFIAITGQRQDESSDRKTRMQQQTIDGSFKMHEFSNCNLYAPVEHWTTDDIWTHIYTNKLEWIDSNTLGRVYAEASNDGDECRSLLEGFDTGSKPGCSGSARFGCLVCTLFEKDKTLNNLTVHYDYLKEIETFRNWLSKFRQAYWDDDRDVFIHGKHKMKKYDIDNHRKGMQIPGGYNLHFRKQILIRLLDTERKIIKERGKPLITDEELAYIQGCWIEDGDLEMSVIKIAYDREFEHLIDPMYLKVIQSVEHMKDYDNLPSFYVKNFSWKWIHNSYGGLAFDTSKFCERYFCQMAIQLEKRGHDSFMIMDSLTRNDTLVAKQTAIEYIKTLPLETQMHFVDSARENYYRKEWKDDKIGFWTFTERFYKGEIKMPTQKTLLGYDSPYADQFEALEEYKEKGDIILCEKISLQDKMRFFDNW